MFSGNSRKGSSIEGDTLDTSQELDDKRPQPQCVKEKQLLCTLPAFRLSSKDRADEFDGVT
eukprot:4968412-Amphidinium_carterae.1